MTSATVIEGLKQALAAAEDDDFVQSLDIIQKALSESGDKSVIYHVMALVAVRMEELPKAIELLKKAHDLAPNVMEHAEALGVLYARIGNLGDSLYYGKLSTALNPGPNKDLLLPTWLGTFELSFSSADESPYLGRGYGALREGALKRALTEFQREAELHPNHGEPWRMLATTLRLQKRPIEEVLILQGLEDSGDLSASDFAEIGHALSKAGRFDEADLAYETAIERRSSDPNIPALKISDMYRRFDIGISQIEEAEKEWGARFCNSAPSWTDDGSNKALDGKITVGFFSSRFRMGAGLDHFWPLFLNNYRGRLKLNLYSYNDYDDAMTRRIAGSVDEFQDLRGVNEKTAAAIIKNDGVDILIDLDGVSEPHHMPLILEKPTPVLLRYDGLSQSAKAMGYDGGIGSEYVYLDSEQPVCAVTGGLFGLPERKAEAYSQYSISEKFSVLGWAPSLDQVHDDALKFLQTLSNHVPKLVIKVFSNGVGGAHGVDELQSAFGRYGLKPVVEFSDWEEDWETAKTNFFSQVDALFDMWGDAGPDNVVGALAAGTPVLSLPGKLPHRRENAAFLKTVTEQKCIFDDVEGVADLFNRWISQPADWQEDQKAILADIKNARTAQFARERFAAFEAAIVAWLQ